MNARQERLQTGVNEAPEAAGGAPRHRPGAAEAKQRISAERREAGSSAASPDRRRQARGSAAEARGGEPDAGPGIERTVARAGKLVRENPAAAAGIAFAAGALAALLLRR